MTNPQKYPTWQDRQSPLGQLLVFAKDTVPSLSVVAAAATIARSRGLRLHVVHVRTGRWRWCATMGVFAPLAVPPHFFEEAEQEERASMEAKVASLLELCDSLEWTFVSLQGTPRQVALSAIRSVHPARIVVGPEPDRRRRGPGLARWLDARTSVPIELVG